LWSGALLGSCRNDVEISEGQCLRMLLAECAWPIAVDGVPARLKVLYSVGAAPPLNASGRAKSGL